MLIKIAVLLPVKVKKLCAFFFKIFQTLCQHNLRGSTHFLLSLCPSHFQIRSYVPYFVRYD